MEKQNELDRIAELIAERERLRIFLEASKRHICGFHESLIELVDLMTSIINTKSNTR